MTWREQLSSRYWQARRWVKWPRRSYHEWRKWRQRPKIGDQVEDCRFEIHTVTGFLGGDEDMLLFEDGHSASWMNCCDTLETHAKRVPDKS